MHEINFMPVQLTPAFRPPTPMMIPFPTESSPRMIQPNFMSFIPTLGLLQREDMKK